MFKLNKIGSKEKVLGGLIKKKKTLQSMTGYYWVVDPGADPTSPQGQCERNFLIFAFCSQFSSFFSLFPSASHGYATDEYTYPSKYVKRWVPATQVWQNSKTLCRI